MTLADAFHGHGTFIYLALETLKKFGNSTANLIDALKQAQMSHVWVRLHDYRMMPEPDAPTRALIDALRGAPIAVAGWGFDAGLDPANDGKATAEMVKNYGLIDYVCDIEQDEHDSKWTIDKIPTFLKAVRGNLPSGAQIAVSSYPYIGGKHPELMRAAVPYVEAFAPQIYWNNYPDPYMLERSALPPHPSRRYNAITDAHKPASYADLCLDWWVDTVGSKPLILTGQAYWQSFPQDEAEAKLKSFLDNFTGWDRVVGVNWWHLGHKDFTTSDGAMSETMFKRICAAQIGDKYAPTS